MHFVLRSCPSVFFLYLLFLWLIGGLLDRRENPGNVSNLLVDGGHEGRVGELGGRAIAVKDGQGKGPQSKDEADAGQSDAHQEDHAQGLPVAAVVIEKRKGAGEAKTKVTETF